MTDSAILAAPSVTNNDLAAPAVIMRAPADGRPSFSAEWRLHRHADYQRVYQSSRKQFVPLMAYFVSLRPAGSAPASPRVGLTAGRVLGKAVERNRIKRRMRAAVLQHFALLPAGVDVVLHPRRQVLEAEFGAVAADVERVFRKVKTAVLAGLPQHSSGRTSSGELRLPQRS